MQRAYSYETLIEARDWWQETLREIAELEASGQGAEPIIVEDSEGIPLLDEEFKVDPDLVAGATDAKFLDGVQDITEGGAAAAVG